ncbi:hypothetical protein FCV25MIE_25777 [Fagus crenata]
MFISALSRRFLELFRYFLFSVTLVLVLGASMALALAFLMGGFRISSQPPALDSRSSRLASRHLSGCSLWSSRSFKSQ